MTKVLSLADEILVTAAERKKGGVKCWTCVTVPPKVLAAIHEAHGRGASVAAISEWLTKRPEFPQGTVSERSVSNHFREKHEARA